MIALDLLRAGAVTVAATPALLLLRKAPGKVRHAAFAAVLAASAAAPFAVGLVPARVVEVAPQLPVLGRAPTQAEAPLAETPKSEAVASVPQEGSRPLPEWLLLLPALIPLGRMVFGWRTARRWIKGATPGPDGTLLSTQATVPMTFFDGLRHRILLPVEASGWSSERLQAVLLHESAHIRRGDWWVQTAARTVVAFQWMNPLAWWMLKGLIDAAEESADQATLQAGVPPQAYARELLSLALPGLRPVGSLPMTPQTDLGRRVVSVLKGRRHVSPISVGFAALAPLALILPAASIGCTAAVAKQTKAVDNSVRREATEDQFGNAANGWVAELPGGRKAKLEYVVGWAKGTPLAWKPDGTMIPIKGLPIGPVKPTWVYVYDKKTKQYKKTNYPEPAETMFVVSFDDPTGVMEAGTQSAHDVSGPARQTFGRGSWTTNPGKPGKRYTAGFISYRDGYEDMNGQTTFKGSVGFAVGPVDATTILSYSEKAGLSIPGAEAAQQNGVSLQEARGGKLDIVVQMKKVGDVLERRWLVAVGRGKDGKVDTESPALMYEGPKEFAHPFYRYSLPRSRSAYESIEILAGATETTEFRDVALLPKGPLQSAALSPAEMTVRIFEDRVAKMQARLDAKAREPQTEAVKREMEKLQSDIAYLQIELQMRRKRAS